MASFIGLFTALVSPELCLSPVSARVWPAGSLLETLLTAANPLTPPVPQHQQQQHREARTTPDQTPKYPRNSDGPAPSLRLYWPAPASDAIHFPACPQQQANRELGRTYRHAVPTNEKEPRSQTAGRGCETAKHCQSWRWRAAVSRFSSSVMAALPGTAAPRLLLIPGKPAESPAASRHLSVVLPGGATATAPGLEAPPPARKRQRLTHLSPEEKALRRWVGPVAGARRGSATALTAALPRRKLKNRVAAQSARDRKKARMAELEQQVGELEQEVSSLGGGDGGRFSPCRLPASRLSAEPEAVAGKPTPAREDV